MQQDAEGITPSLLPLPVSTLTSAYLGDQGPETQRAGRQLLECAAGWKAAERANSSANPTACCLGSHLAGTSSGKATVPAEGVLGSQPPSLQDFPHTQGPHLPWEGQHSLLKDLGRPGGPSAFSPGWWDARCAKDTQGRHQAAGYGRRILWLHPHFRADEFDQGKT